VTFLHDFRPDLGDGGQPNGPLIQASDGNFYGTTRAGGTIYCRAEWPLPCGTIFRMTPAGTVSVLHNFGSVADDGYIPSGSLVQGTDGALYGITSNGGAFGGGGVIFKITLDGTYTILYSFGATPDDGIVPTGGLIQASDGNFYGVTASGGANHCFQIPQAGGNCGTVFRTTPTGETTILYSFGTSEADGVEPIAALVEASDGNFYGTTVNGGSNACTTTGATNNCGTVFRITPTGETTILHSFGPTYHEPIAPQGALVQGADGLLYGTTVSGGGGTGCFWIFACGAVFKTTLTGELSIVYSFAMTSRADGDGPSQLILGRDGNFYGTTSSGGELGGDLVGTAFRLTPAGQLTTLHSFGPIVTNASNPVGGLVEGTDGVFYGVLAYSGQFSGNGAVYRLTPR
jgi:uncharacterized repeat protein (TIGR03803 family)